MQQWSTAQYDTTEREFNALSRSFFSTNSTRRRNLENPRKRPIWKPLLLENRSIPRDRSFRDTHSQNQRAAKPEIVFAYRFDCRADYNRYKSLLRNASHRTASITKTRRQTNAWNLLAIPIVNPRVSCVMKHRYRLYASEGRRHNVSGDNRFQTASWKTENACLWIYIR